MKLVRKWLGAGALFMLTAMSAQAAQVSYAFSVRIDEIDQFTNQVYTGGLNSAAFPLGGQVSVGDIFTGTFSFDQDKLDLPAGSQTPTSRYFWDAMGDAHNISFVTPGGASYSSPTVNSPGILQLQHDSYDYFAIGDYDSNLPVSLTLANWNGGVFHSLDLPSDMKLSDMNYTWFGTSWEVAPGQQIDARGSIVSLTALSPVPEPAAGMSLFAGLIVLGFARRRLGALSEQ
jgi:hypothetical protein